MGWDGIKAEIDDIVGDIERMRREQGYMPSSAQVSQVEGDAPGVMEKFDDALRETMREAAVKLDEILAHADTMTDAVEASMHDFAAQDDKARAAVAEVMAKLDGTSAETAPGVQTDTPSRPEPGFGR